MRIPGYRNRRFWGSVLFGMLALSLTACDAATKQRIQVAVSPARPTVTELRAAHDARMIDNKLEYGRTVSFMITNEGAAGVVQVAPWLSSSEGEWTREQNLELAAGQTQALTYFFHEPTIHASNVQFGVRTKP